MEKFTEDFAENVYHNFQAMIRSEKMFKHIKEHGDCFTIMDCIRYVEKQCGITSGYKSEWVRELVDNSMVQP